MPAGFPIRWQFERRIDNANKRLALALVVSLLLHAVGYVTWRVSPAIASAVKSVSERILPRKFAELQPNPTPLPPPPKREVPMIFVEVDPAEATPEPPKETKNYSTHNSIAANPEPKNLDVPKIDGTQKHVQRTTDNEKPQPKPLQPAPLAPKIEEPKPEEPTPPPPPPAPKKVEVGDLAMVKPDPKPEPVRPERTEPAKQPEKPRKRPTRIAEVLAANPALAGSKMQQDGGVQQKAHIRLDAKGSPFGNYDSVFVSIVQERWYALLDNNRFMLDRRGKVALAFRLHYDGRITQLETDENTVGDLLSVLCQKSILDPAPFPKWPAEMRQIVGTDYRDVKFTFYYD